jgi:hypothetical protein
MMMRRLSRLAAVVVMTVLALVAVIAPAGAQQLVDAGEEKHGGGGLAFVLFAATCGLLAASLVFMDRIRRRREREEQERGR